MMFRESGEYAGRCEVCAVCGSRGVLRDVVDRAIHVFQFPIQGHIHTLSC